MSAKSRARAGSPACYNVAMITKVNPLSVMRQGEEVITDVTRSPVGLLLIFVVATGFLVVVALIALFAVPSLFSDRTSSQQMAIGLTGFGVVAVLVTIFLFFASKIYWDNYWVVTDDSVTQVLRTSLFDKQASQLSLSDIEDVSAEQHGLLANLFNYGVLSCETAAATDKFLLTYCPHPKTYAQQILAGRENFLQKGKAKEPDGDEGSSPSKPAATVDSYTVPMNDDE